MDAHIQTEVGKERRKPSLQNGVVLYSWSPFQGLPQPSKLLLALFLFLPLTSGETRKNSNSKERRFPQLTVTEEGTITGDSGDGLCTGETRWLGAKHTPSMHTKRKGGSCNQ